MRQLVGQIAAQTPTALPPPTATSSTVGSALLMATAPARQLSRCLQLLQSLDTISMSYMRNTTYYQSVEAGKKNRSRILRWGLYKRKEFVQLLGDLRNTTDLLQSLLHIGNNGSPAIAWLQNQVSHVELIDALDRRRVCSFELTDTWDVCSSPAPLSSRATPLTPETFLAFRGFPQIYFQGFGWKKLGGGG